MPVAGENRSAIVLSRVAAGSLLSTYAEESVIDAPKPVIVW